MTELYRHQVKAIEESPDKWGLWFKMRVGKTPTAIRLVTNRCFSGLVICPKGLVKMWEEEIVRWSDNKNVEFFVISRDQFKKRFKIVDKKIGRRVIKTITSCDIPRYDATVVDEVHRGFGNYKSQMFKCLDYYLTEHKIEYIWLLSGTPFTATSWSVYSYGKLLRRPWKWFSWNREFFDIVKMGRASVPIPKAGKDPYLQDILRRLGTIVDLKDVTEVVNDINITEYFELNKRQREEIANINEDLPVTEYIKQHQLEQGSLKSDKYIEEKSFKCAKDDRLVVIAANYEKIIIVCRYKAQIRKLIELFKNRTIYVIWGESKEESSVIAKKAENSPNCVVLIQSDTCDGYSLKSFDMMVFASMSYSFVNYDQIKSRNKAIGKKTPNTYLHLITARDSLDKAVKDSIDKKQTFNIELYEKS